MSVNKYRQSFCLNMIVKNEAPVIRRCLDSVRPIIAGQGEAMARSDAGWNYGSREAAEYSWMSGRMSAHGRAGWRRVFSTFMPLNQILMRYPYYGQIFRPTLPCMISVPGTAKLS